MRPISLHSPFTDFLITHFPPGKMLRFLNLFPAMSLSDSMKPQATTKQIQQQHGTHAKAPNLKLVLKSF